MKLIPLLKHASLKASLNIRFLPEMSFFEKVNFLLVGVFVRLLNLVKPQISDGRHVGLVEVVWLICGVMIITKNFANGILKSRTGSSCA